MSTLISLLFAFTAVAHAAPAPTEQTLRTELQARKTPQFEALLASWQLRYGSSAAEPLLTIARDRRTGDADRYVALMGAAKLGGGNLGKRIEPLLRDPSWMVRNAALHALTALNTADTRASVLAMVTDPALVVRAEAVDCVAKLNPPGATPVLLRAVQDQANYHHGKAQWVPQRALRALAELGDRQALPGLRAVLKRATDRDVLKGTVTALNQISGESLTLAQWKKRP
jgi:HEAT repeat protein